MSIEQKIKEIAHKLQLDANKNHIVKSKLMGNVIKIPVLKNCDNVTEASSDSGAFSLLNPIDISYKESNTTMFLVRLQIPKEELTEDTVEDIMQEMASSLKRNIGLRDDVITYGPTRLSFEMPGRPQEIFLLESSDGLKYELRAYADIAMADRV